MTRTRATFAAAVLALSPILVACGGDSALSAKEFRSQANALCKTAASDTKKLGEDLSASSSEKDITAAIDKLVERNEKLAADVAALKAPDNLQKDVDSMLKDVRAALKTLDEASLAELNSMEDPFAKANEKAKDLGLDDCAQG